MSKISDLVHALYQKTLEKRLTWDVQDDRTLSVNIGRNSINLFKLWNGEDPDLFKISVSNIDGDTVDEENFFPYEDIYQKIEEMMIRAKRNALRADETLDEILEKVNKM